jgi:type I restriction enzyme S subunit
MSGNNEQMSASDDGYKEIQLGPRKITIPEHWEVKKVSDVFNIQKKSFNPDKIEPDQNVALYSMPAYDSGRTPEETTAGEIGSKKYHVPTDTILFPKLNIRKKRFWRVRHNHKNPAVCSTEYWPLLPTEELSLDFYCYYFNSHQFMSDPKVSSSSSTNSHKRVKEKSFKKLGLPVPPIEEQKYMAEIVSTVDEEIRQVKQMKDNLEEMKKGLIQDLFTGDVKVNKNISD